MERFDSIYQRACERYGGAAGLGKLLPKNRSARALAASGDDRYLAQITRCVFQAGVEIPLSSPGMLCAACNELGRTSRTIPVPNGR